MRFAWSQCFGNMRLSWCPAPKSPTSLVRRSFHTGTQAMKSAKTAKDLIKLVNSSSLTQAENSDKSLRLNSKAPAWKLQKLALNTKFEGQQWSPKKKLSREQMESIRLLKNQFPQMTASQLGEQFQVSPEVIRRILKSKWQPDESEAVKIQERWKRRSERITQMFESSSITAPPPRRLVLGSGRSNTEILVKGVRKNFRAQTDKKPTQDSRAKHKLNLLSKLID
ncbi:LANO_0H04588g1_1 [Lachancea nothofagi CBS 11611]|uniref:Required for respiratory growth protein 9, mitochondrial n=1 Tax=Lachancea nothofagi CBS 11611 TaxID=1266666 RepID=A0A1G4KLL0_9SACH|nr:LANO_0H04588g1_1 [Lachancea nothofagi CBS 11611]